MLTETELPPIPKSAWRTLGITSMVTFMVSLEITIIALALPSIREALPGASESQLSWIITGYNIGLAALLLLCGWAADRYGRKRIFLIGLIIFGTGSLLAGLAPTAELLIAARVGQSIGGALQYPAGLALLLPAFPVERRQLAIGIWGATGGLAAAIGPPLGGLLVGTVGWRSVFLINVPVAIAAAIVGRSWLTESRGEDVPDRVDAVSIPLASIGVGAIILAIVQSEEWGFVAAPTIGAAVVGCGLITVFVFRSRRHPAPLFDLGLFRQPSFALGNIGSLLFVIAFFAYFVPIPTFLQTAWGYSPIEAGLAIVPGPLIAAFFSPLSGRWADRFGLGPVLTVGGLAGVAAMGLHLLLTRAEPNLWLGMILPGVVLGVSAGCSFAMLVAAVMRDVPPSRFGMGGAGRTTIFQLAVALAIALAVAIIGRPGTADEALSSSRVAWWLCLAAFAGQAALFAFVYPSERR